MGDLVNNYSAFKGLSVSKIQTWLNFVSVGKHKEKFLIVNPIPVYLVRFQYKGPPKVSIKIFTKLEETFLLTTPEGRKIQRFEKQIKSKNPYPYKVIAPTLKLKHEDGTNAERILVPISYEYVDATSGFAKDEKEKVFKDSVLKAAKTNLTNYFRRQLKKLYPEIHVKFQLNNLGPVNYTEVPDGYTMNVLWVCQELFDTLKDGMDIQLPTFPTKDEKDRNDELNKLRQDKIVLEDDRLNALEALFDRYIKDVNLLDWELPYGEPMIKTENVG